MTKEIKPKSEIYSEIAGLIYRKNPEIMAYFPIIQAHVIVRHQGNEDFPTVEALFSEIEHIEAIRAGRRTLQEILDDTNDHLDPPDFIRASGAAVCPDCNKSYQEHYPSKKYLDSNNLPFLVRLCDGSLVKL